MSDKILNDETELASEDIVSDDINKDENVEKVLEELPQIVVEDFEISMSVNTDHMVKIDEQQVEHLICNFNGNNIVYQTNVINGKVYMNNLDYCRAVEQKFKEKVNVMAEKLNYSQRLI